MQTALGSDHQKSQSSHSSAPCALWPVDLRLTHLDWNAEATLIHFQGQYLTICELDYNTLQGEIQNVPKTQTTVDIGDVCLVEDMSSARWYRGRVQNRREDMFDVFLIDHGNVLTVAITHMSSCSNDLFHLPPKIVCGFLANVLLLQGCFHSVLEDYFSSLIGRNVTGYIQALLPHKVLLLEAPDINSDIVRHGFGRYVDTDTFLLLVEMLTEVPLKQNIEPVPDLLIEKPGGQEFCFKPSGLRGYEDILPFCGPRLKSGTRGKVRVTAAVSPRQFYCQMTGADTDLWEMSKKLATVCEYQTELHNQKPDAENLGLLCSVKAKDRKWYRGYVQFLPVNSQVRVLFIDFGFFDSVKVENVHRLPGDFYSVPIMAFPCFLSSVDSQDEAAKTQQLSFLKAGLLGKVLDVEINSFDEEQQLYSVTAFGAEDNDVKTSGAIQNHPQVLLGSVFETEEMSPPVAYLDCETVIGQEFLKTWKEEGLQVDSVFVGYVEYVQNPNRFWIRTQKRNDEFEEMMTQIENHFCQIKLDEETVVRLEVGAMCCAVYEEDMHFYRAVVTELIDHGAKVLFIDFGNLEKVPWMMIKKIPEAFANKSAFAFCCTLANVFPLDEHWTSPSTDFFRQAVSDKALLVRVVHKRKNKCGVDLYEIGNDNNPSISELLISFKQTDNWSSPVKSVVKTEKHKSENSTTPKYLTSVINTNAAGWEKEENICKNETEKAHASGFKAFHIKPGCEITVRCSYINSLSDFWCQPLDEVSALEEMMKSIQEYYSTHTVPLPSGDSCCISKSSVDGRWYRAFIIDKQKAHAKVLLIDYGFIIQTSDHGLQGILPEYVDLEGQAFRCSLRNVTEPADIESCGSSTAHNSLKDFVSASTGGLRCEVFLQVNMKNKGLCNIVDLYDTQTQHSITEVLVKKGLVREATDLQSAASPETFVYCSFDLVPGKEEVVYVTYVSSQWEVYCHLEKNTDIIEELEKKISEESEQMKQANTRAAVRTLCLAKYFDGKWYRSLARAVQSPLHLSVFFVDYGNSSICEKTQVMFIPRDSIELLFTPMQAVRCSLASVSKEELYADAKKWLEEEVLNKPLRAVIVGKKEDGLFDVELFDGDVNINKKVNELILSLSPKPKTAVRCKASSLKVKHRNSSVSYRGQPKGHALAFTTPNPHRGPQGRSSPQERKENTVNTNGHSGVHITDAQVQQQKQNETKSCVSTTVKKQSEFKGTNRISVKPQHNKGTDVPQRSCLSDKKLDAGFRAKCFASHVESVDSFFLQLSEDEPAILKMVKDLNSDVLRDSLKTTTSVRLNDLVLAEYEEDGALYRSVVRDCHGSSCVIVEFIDYGNSAAVEKQKIYPLPKDYLSQPRFGIPCSLTDASAHENAASFTDAVMEKPLMVEFVCQHEGRWKVTVDILSAAVVLPAALEEGVGSSPDKETGKEEEHPATETEEKVKSYDQPGIYQRAELCESESRKSESVTSAGKTLNIMLKFPPIAPSAKLRLKTSRRHRKLQMKNKTHVKNSRSSSIRVTSDQFETFLPKAKDSANGTLLSVQTNGTFYVRPTTASDLFAVLQSCIADSLPKCKMVAEDDVKPGLKCLAEVDAKWHRALVQQAGSGRCQVFLVDLGVTVETLCGALRGQLSGMKVIPNLALLCKMTFREGEGAQTLLERTMTPMIGKEVKLVFVRYSEAENLWMVEIVMNALLPVDPIAALVLQNEAIHPPPTETRHGATDREPDMETSAPQQLAFAPIDKYKSYFGFAVAVVTPSEFSVVPEDLLHVIKKVSVMLNEPLEPTCPIPEALLTPGTCCLFRSDSERKWCRAEIVDAGTHLVLNRVDYGNCERLPHKDLSELKRLPEELVNLPKVTYPCILRGVKPVGADGQWTGEAAVYFQQCLHQKNLQIFFRESVSNTQWKVDILADGVHVAKTLVDAGHASYLDVMLELRFQEQSPMKASPQQKEIQEEDLEVTMRVGAMSGTSQCLLM